MTNGRAIGFGEQWAREFSTWFCDANYMAEKVLGGYRSERHGNALEFKPMGIRTRLEFQDPERNGRKLHLLLEMSLEDGQREDGSDAAESTKKLDLEYTCDFGRSSAVLDLGTVNSIIDGFLLPGLRKFYAKYMAH